MNLEGNKKVSFIIGIVVAIICAFIIAYLFCHHDGSSAFLPGLIFCWGLYSSVSIYLKQKKECDQFEYIKANCMKMTGKIYKYIEQNGKLDACVRYFNLERNIADAVLPTQFDNDALFPIGMVIDFYEYGGKFFYDAESLRDEVLPFESEMFSEKPLINEDAKLITVSCPNCSAEVKVYVGYTAKCPYCGGFVKG